jgi:hypothetical protein
MVQLEFCDVEFNVPIATSQFDFSPGDVQWEDRTTEQLQKLRKERQAHLAATSGGENAVPVQKR